MPIYVSGLLRPSLCSLGNSVWSKYSIAGRICCNNALDEALVTKLSLQFRIKSHQLRRCVDISEAYHLQSIDADGGDDFTKKYALFSALCNLRSVFSASVSSMVSLEWSARLRRSPLLRLIIDLKTWVEDLRRRSPGSNDETMSALAKRYLLLEKLRSCNLNVVIETGTFLGDTTHFLAARGYNVVTVEIEPRLAAWARARFGGVANVRVVEGDSEQLMTELIADLDQPALFYLDGHYSSGQTGRGQHETPVVKEVEAILRDAPSGSFVIIDDARCFGRLQDYPPLLDFLSSLRDRGVDDAVVMNDSIQFSIRRHCVPKP
jgi:SAM-dependent methyltransferase